MTTEQVAHRCEELRRRVERGLKIKYPRRSVFRWKNRVKAWYDLEQDSFFVMWSSRFAVIPRGVKNLLPAGSYREAFVDDLVKVAPFQSFGGYTDEEHIGELIAWINAKALNGPPKAEGQTPPFIVTYGSD